MVALVRGSSGPHLVHDAPDGGGAGPGGADAGLCGDPGGPAALQQLQGGILVSILFLTMEY